uniref:probable LRR receptor-like serine/threonine-protein kinase At1g51810 n=1 Tax=Erigeron canadensis TaxID=72917 RepID=UPI001CB93C9E|nr:probable LRR receptor-like serine/threonine-protein kinase At1g51810 [Erigeron canadensis]
MFFPIFLLWLLSIPFSLIMGQPPSPPPNLQGYFINCGSKTNLEQDGLTYLKDEGYAHSGNITTLEQTDILPILTTLRYFPYGPGKHCYEFPVITGSKFLIRTTYFYGGFDGSNEPPIFDQIIDGTTWGTVNTSEDYKNGLSSYYEIIVTAQSNTLSICLACNEHTKSKSSPFISSLEVMNVDPSLYNSTDFSKYGLITIARTNFASKGDIVRYKTDFSNLCFFTFCLNRGLIISSFPDDPFNRYWQPFIDINPTVQAHVNVTSSEFWNRPPTKVFLSGSTTSRGKNLTIEWPPFSLPGSRYYVALYFQDNRSTSPYSWRVFTVFIGDDTFYQDLNVSTKGATVYGTEWPLSGDIKITLTPRIDMPVGPTINAGEIYQILPLAATTLSKDAMILQRLKKSLKNPPDDWNGDPCLPKGHPWTGISCFEGDQVRVISLNLTGLSLAGTLPQDIAGLTALKELRLSMNKLSGPVPDLSPLKSLEILHLNDNEFGGQFPIYIGTLPNIHEIFVNNNNFSGGPPQSLPNVRQGVIVRFFGKLAKEIQFGRWR